MKDENINILVKSKKYLIFTTFAYDMVIERGERCYLYDKNGKKYLDFTSNVASSPLGYGDEDIEKIINDISKTGAHKIAGQDFYCKEHVELAEELSKILPKNLKKFFFSNSGAEANENAIKLCYRYKSLKFNINPNELIGISFEKDFHGRTLGVLTFTSSKEVQKKGYPEFKVKRLIFNDENNLNEITEIKEYAAFLIMELMQGEGGYNIAKKSFVKKLYKILKKNEIPLIIDEIQTGLGRSGKWFMFEHYKIKPNILTLAKSLQVGATIVEEKFDPKEAGAISSTWGGGDRIDLAVGKIVIEKIRKHKLYKNAKKMGKYLLKRLKEIEKKFEFIKNARGIGLLCAIDIINEKREKLIQNCFKNGLLLLPCGEKSIRFIPPLIIKKDEIDEGIEIFEKCLKLL